MKENPERSHKRSDADSSPISSPGSRHAIDRDAPAGSENSLGAESIRDGRPATKDDVVEAKDEMPPGTPS